AHEALLRCVAEGVFAVLAVEGSVAEGVEEFPGAVKIQSVHHHRVEPRSSRALWAIADTIRSLSRSSTNTFAVVITLVVCCRRAMARLERRSAVCVGNKHDEIFVLLRHARRLVINSLRVIIAHERVLISRDGEQQ